MIVIVANRWDHAAKAFALRWADYDVRLLTPQDLSVAGWRQSLSGGSGCTAVIDGVRVPHKEITGVLTRMPCVMEEELLDITPEDRPYIAAEMTAFLWYWLASLDCRALNRPTPASLAGPCWRRESWVRTAAQAGIPVQRVHRRAALPASGPQEETDLLPATTVVVTIVGERVFGETDPALQIQARSLADLAEAQLLAVRFSGPECGARFITADVDPDLSEATIAEAVLEFLDHRATK